jgi:hypothetical protein
VVYAKPPFGGPEQVLKYLARYTHRVAISNQRLESLDDGKVTFRYMDYTHSNAQRTMTLDAVEFLRRFLLHVLPRGFMRIRYYGFLANRHRVQKLQQARRLLSNETSSSETESSTPEPPSTKAEPADEPELCPKCRKGRLHVIARLGALVDLLQQPWSFDSS